MGNILILSHEYPPFIGGAGSVAESWIKVLSDQHKVTLVTRYNPHRSKAEASYKLIEVKTKPVIFSFYYKKALQEVFKNNNFDVIILNDLGAAQVASFFFNNEQQSKCWLYFHGNELEVLCRTGIKSAFFFTFFKKLVKKVNKLIFASDFLKQKILNKLDNNSVLANKSFVIYAAIDIKKFYPVLEDNRYELGISANKTIILTVARLVKEKGLEKIIELLKKLQKLGENYHWVLIGSGPFERELENCIEKNNIKDQVTILKKIDREQLKHYYSMANVFVLLSDFEESFGLVYLEANACGTPVIGNNKGGVSEVIDNGVSGYLTSNIDDTLAALKAVKNNNWTKDQLVKHAVQFDEKKLVDRINSLFKYN